MSNYEKAIGKSHARWEIFDRTMSGLTLGGAITCVIDPLIDSFKAGLGHANTLPVDLGQIGKFTIPSILGNVSNWLPGSEIGMQQWGLGMIELVLGGSIMTGLFMAFADNADYHRRRTRGYGPF